MHMKWMAKCDIIEPPDVRGGSSDLFRLCNIMLSRHHFFLSQQLSVRGEWDAASPCGLAVHYQ